MMGVWLLSGCVGDHPDLNSDSTKNTTKETKSSVVAYEDNDYYEDYTTSDYETIDLDKQEGDLTIREGGIYVVSGTMKDGSIIVDAKKNVVRIVLAGVDLTSSHSAPIYVKDAEKVILSLQEGTVNTIQDGDSYDVDENQEPSAAIFSKDDLTINGNGTLKVIAKVKNGIQCKDTLKLMSGTYDIQAVGDGIKGKDAVWIHNGTYQITAEKDGIQTVNADHGEMIIEDGTFTIVSGQDGIQSKTSLMVYDGSFLITSGGGSTGVTQVKNPGEFYDFDEASTISQKGIKAGTTLTLKAGTYDISSIDDALHSNQALAIENGTIPFPVMMTASMRIVI